MNRNKLFVIIFVLLGFLGSFYVLKGNYERIPVAKRNIVYIMIDTLRADHLGVYGYERDTSPVIDKFARESMRFLYAFSPAPWTPPSIASQLSGLYPSSHNVIPPRSREKAKTKSFKFNNEIITIPDALKAQGYKTAGISSNPWISKHYGFDKEFDELVYLHRQKAEIINEGAYKLIDKLSKTKDPFFLYLHYLDPHNPYKPPKEYRKIFTEPLKSSPYENGFLKKINSYDGEIKYLDEQLGKLFQYLKDKDLYKDTIIVIVADHGEQFKEHGDWGHGYQLYNEEIHVPLLIRVPSMAPGITKEPVSLIDIFPTLLELTGTPVVKGIQGVSMLHRDMLTKRAGIMSEISRYYHQKALIGKEKRKLIAGKAAAPEDDAEEELRVFDNLMGIFDYTKKPLETKVEVKEEDSKSMMEILRKIYSASKKAEHKPGEKGEEVPEAVLDELQTLGYF